MYTVSEGVGGGGGQVEGGQVEGREGHSAV